MSTQIVIPVLKPQADTATHETGGAASMGQRIRKEISEGVAGLAVEQDSLDRAIEAASKILDRVINSQSNFNNIRVNALSIRIGVTAGGSVGILGTGVDVKADASFEISFHVTDS
jgi:hypothetical protein